MFIYSCKSISDAFHAIQEISPNSNAKISFFSGKLVPPKDPKGLEVSSLPGEVIRENVVSLSGEELMLQYKDCEAKGLFLSFPMEEAVIFRLLFFDQGVLAISILSETRISLDVPEKVEKILEKYGVTPIAA